MQTTGKILLNGVEFYYEREDNKIMFWSADDLEFELSVDGEDNLDLYYIEPTDQPSSDFFDENWEEIFETVKREIL